MGPRRAIDAIRARVNVTLATQVHPDYPDFWGLCNQRFAELALFGPSNATLAAEISAEVATWSSKFLPYDNFTVAGTFCRSC